MFYSFIFVWCLDCKKWSVMQTDTSKSFHYSWVMQPPPHFVLLCVKKWSYEVIYLGFYWSDVICTWKIYYIQGLEF